VRHGNAPQPVRCVPVAIRQPAAAPRGVTLIELLVVIVVIGLLVALLLPAVQSARESARRTACAHNLRQIGLALHAYHQTYGFFPPGGVEWRPPGGTREKQLAWSVFLLPYLDQQPLYDALDLGAAFDSARNSDAAAQVVTVYVCPTTPRQTNLVEGRGACDYGGIYGERIYWPGRPLAQVRNSPPKGTMLYDHDRPVRISSIRDGLSSTLVVSEDAQWPEGQWINARNVFDQAFGINQAPSFENDIRSGHTKGANGLFADASARFLLEQLDLRVLAAICTRAGEEAVGDF